VPALNVTCGDIAAALLAESGLEGQALPWRDVLHDGPAPALPRRGLRAVRAGFLAECGWDRPGAALDFFTRRDEAVAAADTC